MWKEKKLLLKKIQARKISEEVKKIDAVAMIREDRDL